MTPRRGRDSLGRRSNVVSQSGRAGRADPGRRDEKERQDAADREQNEKNSKRLLVAGGTGFGGLLLTLPLKSVGLLPEVVVVRVLAITTLAIWFFYLVYCEIHVEGVRLAEDRSRAHVTVVACEVLVVLALPFSCLLLFLWPDGTLQFLVTASLAAAVIVLGWGMSRLVETLDLKSDMELAENCWLINFVRDEVLGRFNHLESVARIDSLFELKVPTGNVNYLVIAITLGLSGVAAANTPAVAPPAYQFLKTWGITAEDESDDESEEGANEALASTELVASSPPAATVAPSPEPEPVLEVPAPTYQELCGSRPSPGEPAPEPWRSELFSQFLGPTGLGAILAGCAEEAEEAGEGVWIVPGTCEGLPRSLAVSVGQGAGAILLWAPARFALARAEEGELLGATSSRLVGEGEVYSVTTTAGTYAFVRSEISDGEGGLAGVPRQCGDLREGAVPYVVLGPALTRLWSTQIELGEEWLWPEIRRRSPDGSVEYAFDPIELGSPGAIIGSCESDTDCRLWIDGAVSTSSGPGPIDVERLLEIAPPPAG